MNVYERYFILANKNDDKLFLTEDRTYTEQLVAAETFRDRQEATNRILDYLEQETDEFYSRDFYVALEVEVKMVEVQIESNG